MSVFRRAQYELMRGVVGPALAGLQDAQTAHKRRRRKPRPSPLGPPPETGRLLRKVSTSHYFSGRYADRAVPVAWVTSGAPIEILRPLGYYLVYPENHGAICGAGKISEEPIAVAEDAGFSQDLCSYARIDFGTLLSGKTPVGRIPPPDLLVCCTNICQTVLYWYRELARQLDVPLVLLDTPYVYGQPEPAHIRYVTEQLRQYAETAARVAGKRFDEAVFTEAVVLARDGCVLWGECLATNRQRPAPWTAFDGFIHMIPIVTMRGTEACNAYYRVLRDELQRRGRDGIAGVVDERYRLLWDNLPVWFRMRDLSRLLADNGFAMVAATYTNAWAETATLMDTDDPWEGLATAYSMVILNRDLGHRLELIRNMAREYECDGVLFHSDRSCKPYSVGQLELREALADEGIRSLVLDADHADPRSYADGPAETRLRAFMETFES